MEKMHYYGEQGRYGQIVISVQQNVVKVSNKNTENKKPNWLLRWQKQPSRNEEINIICETENVKGKKERKKKQTKIYFSKPVSMFCSKVMLLFFSMGSQPNTRINLELKFESLILLSCFLLLFNDCILQYIF